MTSQSAEELISVLEEQETRLVLESFTHDDAWRLGTLLVEMARERSPSCDRYPFRIAAALPLPRPSRVERRQRRVDRP